MSIIVNLDVMLAKRKMRSKELAERIGITEQNISLLKSGKVRGVRFDTLNKICEVLNCQPGDLLEYRADGAVAELLASHGEVSRSRLRLILLLTRHALGRPFNQPASADSGRGASVLFEGAPSRP